MTRLGITGHQVIPAQALSYVITGIQAALASLHPPLVGYSSLAAGADQLFARELLAAGGELNAIIPCHGYQVTFSDRDRAQYFDLIAAATSTTVLQYSDPSEAAYEAAGKWVAEHCQTLVAVWDGEPSRGRGGTADVVAYAQQLGKDVRIVWPTGVPRD